MAARLREVGVSADSVKGIICRSDNAKPKKAEKSVKLPTEMYEKYFQKADAGRVVEIIEEALEAWFAGTGYERHV